MAKQTETPKTKIFESTDSSGLIQRVEIAESKNGGYYVSVIGEAGRRDTELSTVIDGVDLGKAVSSSIYNGKPVQTFFVESEPLQAVQALENSLEINLKEKVEKKTWAQRNDLMKWRGHLGNVGQVFILGSALGINYEGKKKTRKDGEGNIVPKYSGHKLASTILSIFGNGINSFYGVQKKDDKLRLTHVKEKVNTMFKEEGISTDKLSLTHEKTLSASQKSEIEPATAVGRFNKWHQQYSIKTSNAIKLVGKYLYLLSGKKQENSGNTYHGYLSIAAKISTLTGLDEDPYNLEKRAGPIDYIRTKSTSISGFLEWLGNFSLIYGAVASDDATEKQEMSGPLKYLLGDKVDPLEKDVKKWDWLQLIGALSVGVAFVFKMFSPFTSKKIDVEEFVAHTTVGLAQQENMATGDAVGNITSKILSTKELPEMHELGFAGTFAALADDLEFRRGVSVKATATVSSESPVASAESPVQQPSEGVKLTVEKHTEIEERIAEQQAQYLNVLLAKESEALAARTAEQGEVVSDLLVQVGEEECQPQEAGESARYLRDIKNQEHTPLESIKNGEHKVAALSEAFVG